MGGGLIFSGALVAAEEDAQVKTISSRMRHSQFYPSRSCSAADGSCGTHSGTNRDACFCPQAQPAAAGERTAAAQVQVS